MNIWNKGKRGRGKGEDRERVRNELLKLNSNTTGISIAFYWVVGIWPQLTVDDENPFLPFPRSLPRRFDEKQPTVVNSWNS